MKFFTRRQWRQHLEDQRYALEVARSNKPSDYEREQLARLRRLVDDLWQQHSKPYPDGEPGDARFGQTWWCPTCRTQWPCRIARFVFKAKGMGANYLPLRMPIRGETRLKGAIKFGGGTWLAVPGVEPDDASKSPPEVH